MDMSATPHVAPGDVLDSLARHVDRTRLLLGTLDDCFGDDFLAEVKLETPATKELADRAMMLIDISRREIGEAASTVEACYELILPAMRSSVGRHVDIVRRRAWAAARDAYNAAEAAPNTDEAVDAAGEAFRYMLATPAPDMRAFHEKLALVHKANAWAADGFVEALFADVETFARAEIAAAKLEG